MPPDSADDVPSDAHRLRHELLSALTIIRARTQLLQRQLERMDGFSDGNRQRLAAGLAAILTAARALDTTLDQLPAIQEEREAS